MTGCTAAVVQSVLSYHNDRAIFIFCVNVTFRFGWMKKRNFVSLIVQMPGEHGKPIPPFLFGYNPIDRT